MPEIDRQQLIDALAQLPESEARAVISAARKQDQATKKSTAAAALQRLIAGTTVKE